MSRIINIYNSYASVVAWNNAKSIYLDGVNECIDTTPVLADLKTSDEGTIFVWVKLPVVGAAGQYPFIWSFGDTNYNTTISLAFWETTGLYAQCIAQGGLSWRIRTQGFGSMTADNWALIGFTKPNLYQVPFITINGVKINHDLLSNIDANHWFYHAAVAGLDNGRIGCWNYNNGGDTWNLEGNVDEPLFINRALTEAQHLDVYNAGVAKDESGIADGVSSFRMGDDGSDNWDGTNWNFKDVIGTNDIVTINCEEADVENDAP